MATFSKNDDYMVQIHIDGDNTDIYAYLPEQIAMSSQSTWSSIMGSALGGLIDKAYSVTNTAGKATGYQINPIFQSVKGWEGNSPMTFSLDLQFNAYTDPVKDVIYPIYRLLQLTCPEDLGNGMVKAPGPNAIQLVTRHLNRNGALEGGALAARNAINKLSESVSEGLRSDESITLTFGNFLRIQNVVCTNVSPRFDTQFHNGQPISAEAQVEFEMMFSPTRDMLENMFIGYHTNR